MAARSSELIPTRVSLLKRLPDLQDNATWEEFFEIYWKLIFGVARKAGLTEVEAEDVVQETMFALIKHIAGFKYDPAKGSFKTWLLNMTRWRIVDQFHKRLPVSNNQRAEDSTTGTSIIDKVIDPKSEDLDAAWNVDWEKTVFAAAVQNMKKRADPRKYQIFDFYVRKEWPAEKVASTFGVSVEQVYLAKHRLTEMIKEEVKRMERDGI
jgi:RNA polymerase sigma factor (sigma-70 family)